jgi:hypothetical protein
MAPSTKSIRRCHHHLWRLTSVVCLSIALPLTAIAQTSAPTQPPPSMQDSIAKGMAAVKQQDWSAAIRYFGEARTAAPESPLPHYNLGLAEAQVPGRELRAICWFEAYLRRHFSR